MFKHVALTCMRTRLRALGAEQAGTRTDPPAGNTTAPAAVFPVTVRRR